MSISIPQLPKGTRDFYPEAERIQNYIFDTWRSVAESFAYEEYEGPMFEHLELYTGKSGEEIVSQLYNFKDKGDREIALRPEMTPTLARLVIQKARELKKPFKWFSMPRLFRYEKAQKGRLREFFQLNMDIIGTESIYAEADLMAAIATMLRKFGLKDGEFAIGVSSRKLLATYLEEIGAPNPALVYPVLDRRLKIGPEAFAKALADAGLSEDQVKKLDDFMSCKSIEEVKTKVHSENATAALAEIEDLFATLTAAGYGECVNLDLSIVRGLATTPASCSKYLTRANPCALSPAAPLRQPHRKARRRTHSGRGLWHGRRGARRLARRTQPAPKPEAECGLLHRKLWERHEEGFRNRTGIPQRKHR